MKYVHLKKIICDFIIFRHIAEKNDIISKLNEFHLWYKQPNLVIINDLEYYCEKNVDSEYDFDKMFFLIASLMDALSVTDFKNSEKCSTIVSSKLCKSNPMFSRIIDLYFTNYLIYQEGYDDYLLNVFNKTLL